MGRGSVGEHIAELSTEAVLGGLGRVCSQDELRSLAAERDELVAVHMLTSEDMTLSNLVFARDLHQRVLSLLGNEAAIDSRHPLEAQLARVTADAVLGWRDRVTVEELSHLLTEGLIRLAYLVVFVERRRQVSFTTQGPASGVNQRLVELRRATYGHMLQSGEMPINVGESFLLDGTSNADGLLVVTDQRLMFIFDEDYERDSLFVDNSDLVAVDFLPTDAVPMSEVLLVRFRQGTNDRVIQMFVGHRFADELRQVFR
jgi:hypothetical protein